MRITSDAEHAACLLVVTLLMRDDPMLGSPEGDALALLAERVDEYELRRWPL